MLLVSTEEKDMAVAAAAGVRAWCWKIFLKWVVGSSSSEKTLLSSLLKENDIPLERKPTSGYGSANQNSHK